jgi:hypothetical protein
VTGFAACDLPMWLAVTTPSLDNAIRARTRFSQLLNLRVFQQYLRIPAEDPLASGPTPAIWWLVQLGMKSGSDRWSPLRAGERRAESSATWRLGGMPCAQGTETQASQMTGRLFEVLAFKCLSVYQLAILAFNYLYSAMFAAL